MPRAPQPVGEERALAIDLTAAALLRAAPDEIPVLDETAAEFYADPDAALRRDGGDSPLGAGVEILMLTPYVLTAASAVLPLLAAFAGELLKGVALDVAKEPLSTWVRRMIRGRSADPREVLTLTAEQARRVRATVVEQCFHAGLPSAQATLIADATVGALHVAP